MRKKLTLIAGPARSGKTTKAFAIAGKRKRQTLEVSAYDTAEIYADTQVLIFEGVFPKDFEFLKMLVTWIDPPFADIDIIATLHPSVKNDFEEDERITLIQL